MTVSTSMAKCGTMHYGTEIQCSKNNMGESKFESDDCSIVRG